MPSDNMTVAEVAAYLLVSRQTVYTMVRDGSLPHFKIGSKIRFRRSDIEAIATPKTSQAPKTKPVTTGVEDE